MESGEKYLNVVLLGGIKVAAFPNKERPKGTEPHWKGDGIAIWENTKK